MDIYELGDFCKNELEKLGFECRNPSKEETIILTIPFVDVNTTESAKGRSLHLWVSGRNEIGLFFTDSGYEMDHDKTLFRELSKELQKKHPDMNFSIVDNVFHFGFKKYLFVLDFEKQFSETVRLYFEERKKVRENIVELMTKMGYKVLLDKF
jgi:hypothetical protein